MSKEVLTFSKQLEFFPALIKTKNLGQLKKVVSHLNLHNVSKINSFFKSHSPTVQFIPIQKEPKS